jgi:branched-chain amino acid transport system permease protein
MIPTQQSDSARLITPTMLVLFLVLATVPLWIARAGLYPYLGIEILIWSLYALAFNLVLGTAGLPSFGHGAYFGIGAYAFGLCQFNVVANLWICLAAAFVIAGLAGALVALFISHRRGIYYAFMTIAFGQIFWTLAIKSHKVTGGEDGLLKIARLPADLGFASFDLAGNVAFYYFVLVVFGLAVIVAVGAFALWPRHRGHQAERNPRCASRLQCLALQGIDLHAVGGGFGPCRRVVRNGATRGIP